MKKQKSNFQEQKPVGLINGKIYGELYGISIEDKETNEERK